MENQLNRLIGRYPQLSVCMDDINQAYLLLEEAYSKGRKLLVCGNGGSASDSEHIVGELMKEFKLKRRVYSGHAAALKEIDSELGQVLADNLQGALPAISLTGHSSLQTAFMNDAVPELVFAQQVNGYGKPAKAKGLKVIGLTGAKENKLMKYADVCIRVPEIETYKIQELHLPVYHCLCLMLEEHFFGNKA